MSLEPDQDRGETKQSEVVMKARLRPFATIAACVLALAVSQTAVSTRLGAQPGDRPIVHQGGQLYAQSMKRNRPVLRRAPVIRLPKCNTKER